MINKGLDKSVEEIVEADEVLRGLIPFSDYKIQVVNEPWTLETNPWRVTWVGKHTKEVCAVVLVQIPQEGEKYVLITTLTEDEKVMNYVFQRDQYHSLEKPE